MVGFKQDNYFLLAENLIDHCNEIGYSIFIVCFVKTLKF